MNRFLRKMYAVLFLFSGFVIPVWAWAQLPTQTEFIAICENNDHQRLRDLFNHTTQDQIQAWINKPLGHGSTPLLMAVSLNPPSQDTQQYPPDSCCKDVIKLLYESGADVNYICPGHRRSVLIAAACYGYTDTVKGLLDAKAEVNYVNPLDGWSALMVAANKGYTNIVRLLLDAGAEVNHVEHMYGWSALTWAVHDGHITSVVTLLGAQAQVDTPLNLSGDTPLHIAIRKNHPVLVTLLLQANAAPTSRNHEREMPMDVAKTGQHNPGIDILWEVTQSNSDKERRKELFGINCYGENALHQSIREGDNMSVAQHLKKSPQFLNIPRTDGCTPLHVAVLHNNVKALVLLLQNKVSLSPMIKEKDTPLQWILQLGREHMLGILAPAIAAASFDKTAEIHREWIRQNSPLSLPVWAEHVIRTSYSVDQIKSSHLPLRSIARIIGSDKTIDADDLPPALEAVESHIQSTPSFNRQSGRSKP